MKVVYGICTKRIFILQSSSADRAQVYKIIKAPLIPIVNEKESEINT